MKDERITIRVQIGSHGTLCLNNDREICGFNHTIFTYGIKLRPDGEVIKDSYASSWLLGYFGKIEE